MNTPTAQHILADTIGRYMETYGERPSRIRATFKLRWMFMDEMQHLMAFKCTSAMPVDEFEFMGVRVKCDLPSSGVACVARYEGS